MLRNHTLDKDRLYSVLLWITCGFVALQPIFDLLSFLHIRGYISVGISTYGKPLIIGLINIALLLIYKKHIWRCAMTYGSYLVLTVVHVLLMNGMLVETSVILHEIRFMINFLYLLICYHDFRILYDEAPQKDVFAGWIKKTLAATFALYILLFLVAIITGTSGRTYEYSDELKQGYKGWLDSGQIFGHALCVCLPFLICYLLNNKVKNQFLRILCKLAILFPVLVLCLIGTKVTFYIPLLVLAAQIILELFFAIKGKNLSHLINAVICVVCIVACLVAYPITPVKQNIDINNSVLMNQPDRDTINQIVQNEKDKQNIGKKPNVDNEDNQDGDSNSQQEALKNADWTMQALQVLEQKYVDGELHPADMRNRQLYFNLEKYKQADLKYKIFGLGYLNQGDMAIERDVLCVVFSFGILCFIIVLLRPMILWFRSAFIILRRLFKMDIMTLCLFEGFSMFFFISWYAGYTFIYTNFSIFLAIIMVLLNDGISRLKNKSETTNDQIF